MKKQKLDENKSKDIVVIQDDSDNEEEYENNDLSPTEIFEKQKEAKEIEQKLKELEEEKEKIENELDQKNKLKEIYDEFKKERNQFVFKIEYDDSNFYESLAKNYMTAILKNMGKSQNLKVLKIKVLNNYIWFKTDKKIAIKWFIRKVEKKGDYIGFKITQLRVNNFFEDI